MELEGTTHELIQQLANVISAQQKQIDAQASRINWLTEHATALETVLRAVPSAIRHAAAGNVEEWDHLIEIVAQGHRQQARVMEPEIGASLERIANIVGGLTDYENTPDTPRFKVVPSHDSGE
ncbi:hypothetical protein [Devosia submarina]|uniref:hypothetical protein n=1 Tax=Devosia submarina TaxID=1173082 RepID=UPI000D382950|nr:hypothetical protein [Devosia submarina]